MKLQISTKIFVFCASLISSAMANSADSVQTVSGASVQASKAVSLGVAASGQATLGVMALPMLSAGVVSAGVGGASIAAGKTSAAAASSSTTGPLPVADETITITSPTEALKQRTSATHR